MEKLKVNRDIYEELVRLELYYGKDEKSKNKMIGDFCLGKLTESGQKLHSITFYDFSRMVILGYELQETKSEKLAREYNEQLTVNVKYGIKYALDSLGIEIEGINK